MTTERVNAERKKMRRGEKRRKRQGKKSGEGSKSGAENVAGKRGWTKESAATALEKLERSAALRAGALSPLGRRTKALSARKSLCLQLRKRRDYVTT